MTVDARLGSKWPVALVILAGTALAAPMWLAPHLPYGHDSLPHIFNLFALDRQIEAGNIYPLRFPQWGYGYGYAVLAYYPPLGYYLMEFGRLLGANFIVAYKMGITLIILGAGLASYRLGAALFGRAAGVVISLAYVYNPYFLTVVYTRAALAESLGLAVAPWVFLAFFRAVTAPGWRSYILTSLALALLVLAHPLSTLLFAPFLVAYAVLLLIQVGARVRARGMFLLAASGLTAALMTCFYWAPVLLEGGGLRTVDPQLALNFYASGLKPPVELVRWGWTTALPHEYTLATFSIVVPLLAGMSLLHFLLTYRRRSSTMRAQFVFLTACILSALWFMSTSASQLWLHFPPIRYVQFPFRWFGPLALFTALVIGGSLRVDTFGWFSRLYRVGVVAFLVFLIITSVANVPVAPSTLPADGGAAVTSDDVNELGLRRYERDHTDAGYWVWVNEYIPSTSFLSDYLQYQYTALLDVPVHSMLPSLQAFLVPTAMDDNRLEAEVSSPEPWVLSLHAFWIPGWTATIDGKPAPTEPTDEIGVVGVALPAGEHQVRLAFGPTSLRSALYGVSLLALAAWLAVVWWRHRRLAAMVSAALLLMAVLVGGRALRAPSTPALQPLDANLGNQIGLQGFALDRTGDTLTVHLVWLARQPMEESHKVFIHVFDDQGKPLAQTDSRPLNYADNTNRWIPGQVIYDHYEVPVPPDAPPGSYQVRVGMYNEADGQRLPVLDAAGQQVDDQVLLGSMVIP